MADADPVTIALVGVVVAFAIIGVFEMRFLRKKRKNRRVRTPKGESELPDSAHNAVTTTKAIMSSMERQGIRSPEASAWVRDAEMAYQRRNYRVVLELTGKARERLLALKSADAAHGDLVKLEQLAPVGADAVTTKEMLQKEVPPNLVQSKFSIDLAVSALDQARLNGRDVAQASDFLDAAKGRFDLKDYDGALSMARLSKRSAEGQAVEVPARATLVVPGPPVTPAHREASVRSCPSCGSGLGTDDVFCRKCGTKLVPSACASCGADLLSDDAYCPKCGARISA